MSSDVKRKAASETSVSASGNPRVCVQGLRPGSASGVCVQVTFTAAEPVRCLREPQGQPSAYCPAPSTCPAGGLRGSGLSQGQGPRSRGEGMAHANAKDSSSTH